MRVVSTFGLVLTLAMGTVATAQGTAEEALLERVRSGQVGDRTAQEAKIASYRRSSSAEQKQQLREARARRDELQSASQALEDKARSNKKIFDQKIAQLRAELGPDAALFGSLQQISSDLVGIFRNSSTSLEYPNREQWLSAFIARMEKASEIFTIEELEKIWFLLQQEITASGQIVTLSAEILGESGTREQRDVVRVGKFNLISNEPAPAYLTWHAETQRASLLKRQPEGQFLGQIGQYVDNTNGTALLGIDPTGGSLLSRLVDAPSLRDRIDAGGLIGYLILILGAFGVAIAVFKLIGIVITSLKVSAQRRDVANPKSNNPLGRMLLVYENNKSADTETLEMRLGEAILEERPKIDRYIGTVKVISAVAPLMGLMGTVIGMIATFQAITLFGTGDPKTMAGGISQALVTTVEGLTVAIPTVLLHAIVSARATSLINTLKHQTAGLIAERMEQETESTVSA